MAVQSDSDICPHLWKVETFHDGSVSVKCPVCNTSVTIGGSFIRIYHADGSLKVDTIDLRTLGI
jgi:hypothetical protein